MDNLEIQLSCTPVKVDRMKLRDMVAISPVSKEPITINFGINTNLSIDDRKPFDDYIVGIVQGIIFEYFNQIYQRYPFAETLNFNPECGKRDANSYEYYSHRFDCSYSKKGPEFLINITCKAHKLLNIPDYSVSIVLKGMPWDALLYHSVPRLVQKDFLQQLKMWVGLKIPIPDGVYTNK